MATPKHKRNRALSIVTEDFSSPSGQMQSPFCARGLDRNLFNNSSPSGQMQSPFRARGQDPTLFNKSTNELSNLKDSTDSNGSRNKGSEPSSMDSLNENYAGNRGPVFAPGGNGANDSMGMGYGSPFSPAYQMSPGGAAQMSPRGVAPGWSGTPTSPNMPLPNVFGLAVQLGSLRTHNRHLENRNQELAEELAEYKKKDHGKGGRRSNGPNTPNSRGGNTPNSRGGGNTGSIRNTGSGTALNVHVTPIANRVERPECESSTPTPFTPTLFTPKGTAFGFAQMKSGPSSTTRRHKRTETPDLISSLGGPVGKPVYTVGMMPQDDRGLISDFMDEIKSWTSTWIVQEETLSPEKQEALAYHPAIHEFLQQSTDVRQLVTDQVVRCALVAAIVTQDIILNGLCEHFLSNSEHPAAKECDAIFKRYINLGPAEMVAKHGVLLERKALYTKIKENPDHREWRTETAKKLSKALAAKLGGLVRDDDTPTRNGTLKELFIKGYRIGFRLGMSTMEWQMHWPTDGDKFDMELMVNESRNLCGGIARTIQMVSAFPQNYTVRFATSPTIRRYDFSSGSEQETVIHKAMVHLSRSPQPIGAERNYFISSQFGR